MGTGLLVGVGAYSGFSQMRAFPELVAMVKGVKVASRAVGSALLMLFLLVYVG